MARLSVFSGPVPHEEAREEVEVMHRNPVKRSLVDAPEQWHWSSYHFYLLDEVGPVLLTEGWTEMRSGIEWRRTVTASVRGTRPFAKYAKERGTHFVGDSYFGKTAKFCGLVMAYGDPATWLNEVGVTVNTNSFSAD